MGAALICWCSEKLEDSYMVLSTTEHVFPLAWLNLYCAIYIYIYLTATFIMFVFILWLKTKKKKIEYLKDVFCVMFGLYFHGSSVVYYQSSLGQL